jgi:ketosteroid isomerase-like protein
MPRDLHAFFQSYRDAFNALDGHAVAALYAEPSGIAQDGSYTHWGCREAVAENMVALCHLYRQKGFVRADFEPGVCVDQGQHHAVADVAWLIEWNGGQAPWRFSTTYNLTRTGDGWRVLLCTAYSEGALHRAAKAAGPTGALGGRATQR